MKKFVTLLFILTCATIHSEAQSFLDHLQKKEPGKASVKVSQSKDIDELVNGKVKITITTLPQAPTTSKSKQDDKPSIHPLTPHKQDKITDKTKEDRNNKQESSVKTTERRATKEDTSTFELDIPTIDMRKKVMRKSYKINGYRVQAFAGGNSRADRLRAESIRDNIKQVLPNEPIYVHFYSPRWICRVGNYRSYEEAARILKQVKGLGYKQACIVRGKITVQY
ncbi:SPOR domain-containing protein [Hoylesella timonensis]|uniref:Sporulation and cell division repeat protein n=1 Tax=Hoylesella timonensis CRIS 5C-B1 TaxID=679189 RepID=D1VXU0_9BACT|nr:SPOR domain-containing protein [Hoylesella timonensis]EFA98013.1 sporulation and cell division repeat protein [Hoylesella timonensis CRIS 5C-B1]